MSTNNTKFNVMWFKYLNFFFLINNYYNFIIINNFSNISLNNIYMLNIFINIKNSQGFLKKNKLKIKNVLNKKSYFFSKLSKLRKLKYVKKKKFYLKKKLKTNLNFFKYNKKFFLIKKKKFNCKYLDFRKKYLSKVIYNRKNHFIANYNNIYQRSYKVTKKINKYKNNGNYQTYLQHEFFLAYFFRNINFLVFFKDYRHLQQKNYFLINFNIVNKNSNFLKIYDLISLNCSKKYINYLNFFIYLKKKQNFYKYLYKFKKFKKKKNSLKYDIFYSKFYLLKNGYLKVPSYLEINYNFYVACIIKDPNPVTIFKNQIFKHSFIYVTKQLNWYH